MNKELDKYLDDLNKKVIKNTLIESPSIDFTASVMNQVTELKTTSFTYKPLISRVGWLVISILIISFIVLIAYINGITFSSSIFERIDLGALYNNKLFNTLSNIKVSEAFTNSIILFGIMFSIQIPFLKHYFNKRFE